MTYYKINLLSHTENTREYKCYKKKLINNLNQNTKKRQSPGGMTGFRCIIIIHDHET